MEEACLSRHNPEIYREVGVELKKILPRVLTWDDKKNDELANRKLALQRFMGAGSQIIIRYRLQKRITKIKEFLRGC